VSSDSVACAILHDTNAHLLVTAMSPIKVAGLVLIVAGALMLGYGSFSYTKEDTAVKIGPIELSVKEKKTVNFPVWAGIGAIVVGGLLLVLGRNR